MERQDASTLREEGMRRFVAFVGSSSDGHGESTCRQMSHQNRHLNCDLKHVL